MFRLSDLVSADAVLLDVNAEDKDQLLDRMLGCLVALGRVSDRGCVSEALLERETVMSTGIGHGVAIPHAQCSGADRLSVALARLRTPIEFDSIDASPVQLVFLVVGPVQKGGFLQVLARISRLLCLDQLQEQILEAEDAEGIVGLIEEKERLLT